MLTKHFQFVLWERIQQRISRSQHSQYPIMLGVDCYWRAVRNFRLGCTISVQMRKCFVLQDFLLICNVKMISCSTKAQWSCDRFLRPMTTKFLVDMMFGFLLMSKFPWCLFSLDDLRKHPYPKNDWLSRIIWSYLQLKGSFGSPQ